MKLKLSDIAYNYLIKSNVSELWTDNLDILHQIYDLYRYNPHSYYRPLKNEHPLNILRAVRSAFKRDNRFQFKGCFNSKWGKISYYKLKENSNDLQRV